MRGRFGNWTFGNKLWDVLLVGCFDKTVKNNQTCSVILKVSSKNNIDVDAVKLFIS